MVQGVTEWLPISSSGHLVVVQEYLGLQVPVILDVVLHLGSLLVVLAAFWGDLLKVLKAVARLDFRSEYGKLGVYVILGSIVTVAIGLILGGLFESFFYNLLAVGVAFILTGSFYSLLYFFRRGGGQSRPMDRLSALLVGVAQGIALVPGVSRSGSTISTGLLLKVGSKEAYRFSFLLFIPAVIGAMVFTLWDSRGVLTAGVLGVDVLSLFLGIVVTVVVGFLSLKVLLRVVLREKLHLFAFYCWALGIVLVLSQIV